MSARCAMQTDRAASSVDCRLVTGAIRPSTEAASCSQPSIGAALLRVVPETGLQEGTPE